MNSRNLLSSLALGALLLVGSASATFADVNILGSLSGYATGTIQGGTLQAAAGGTGNASHLGNFSYVLQATVALGAARSEGTFLLSFPNGEVMYGALTGQNDAPTQITETLTINGGTGRFQGASGTLRFTRVVEVHVAGTPPVPVYDSHSGILNGTIKLPSK